MSRFTFFTIFIIVFLLCILVYFRFLNPYEKGDRTGKLKDFVQRGYVFKTYEGILQTNSDTLAFSVADKTIADSLMNCQGKIITVRYEKFQGTLPWRGSSKMVVTKLLNVQDSLSPVRISY